MTNQIQGEAGKDLALSTGQVPKASSLSGDLSLTSGVELIRRERERQIEVEGWSANHDLQHDCGELAVAAACYAVDHTDAKVTYPRDDPEGSGWPWGEEWWKPKDTIRNLVRAGALIAAEIDREIEMANGQRTNTAKPEQP